jgi:hypothetical protein
LKNEREEKRLSFISETMDPKSCQRNKRWKESKSLQWHKVIDGDLKIWAFFSWKSCFIFHPKIGTEH